MITTDIDFPSSLPCGLREGYDLNHVQPFVRTPMDSGRSRQRRKFTSVPTMAYVQWNFNSPQTMAFEAWFRDTLLDGTAWFNCMLRTPMGIKHYVCRFVDMYNGPRLTAVKSWRIVARLEIWERPLLPDGWGLMPDFVTGMDIFDLAMNREWPEA